MCILLGNPGMWAIAPSNPLAQPQVSQTRGRSKRVDESSDTTSFAPFQIQCIPQCIQLQLTSTMGHQRIRTSEQATSKVFYSNNPHYHAQGNLVKPLNDNMSNGIYLFSAFNKRKTWKCDVIMSHSACIPKQKSKFQNIRITIR